MPEVRTQQPANVPAPLIESLATALYAERDALVALSDSFAQQLDAIRRQRLDLHEDAMEAANAAVADLGRHRATRERQTRLLGRVLRADPGTASLQDLADLVAAQSGGVAVADRLREARAAVRAEAEKTQRICEQLDFALKYAVNLGREMVQMVQALDVPPPARVYTSAGGAAQAAGRRSLVNKTG